VSQFNTKLKQYLTLYKPPITPESLDPQLFYVPEQSFFPVLVPAIRMQILSDIEVIRGHSPARVDLCAIVGNAVTPGKKDRTSDVRVMVLLNKRMLDKDIEAAASTEILQLCKHLSNKYAIGTTRKIVYVPTLRPEQIQEKESVYCVVSDSWIKSPFNIKQDSYATFKRQK
jgi:hypothetical protein